MLTLLAISDRFELQDLVNSYASAIDTRNYQKLRNIFVPDASVDASDFGGPVGDFAAFLAWVEAGMAAIGGSHHMMANHQYMIDGDRAEGRVMCYNPMECPAHQDGSRHIMVCGLYYLDEYVRTPEGWRINSRVMQKTYIFNTSSADQIEA